ncbi:MAG: hypothetical protein LW865_01805 [Betaproteobacteria bacterium]|jgi:putative lipoic acid-binding regulatory protein|nr:hypothetical protein [Betaproteobacteria bacterium]
MSSRKWPCRRRFTITVGGKTDADLEDAMTEVNRLIREGNLAGHNRNESGSFYFDSTDTIPNGELPA